MMIQAVSNWITPLFCRSSDETCKDKVREAVLPVLACLGLFLLALLPIPYQPFILAGAALAAAVYFYEPPLGEPFVLPKLKPLFSPRAQLLLHVELPKYFSF